MYRLNDKLVFITGASSGIGAACAKLFAQHGARLLLCARRVEKLSALAEELKQQYSSSVYSFELDVRDKAAVATTIVKLPQEWQAIDILINNAGLAAGLDKIQDAKIADWDAMIDTNIKGLMYVTKAVVLTMIQRNQGHIINLGSIAGHDVYPAGSVYCGTKYAVNAISQGIKLDLLGTNIRVTSIDPGAVKTEFSEVRFEGNKQKAEAVYNGFNPLTPEDIADAIVYCATRPPHVNITEMILLPTQQGSANHIHRYAVQKTVS